MISFELNGTAVRFDGDPEMPLLWYLRDHAGLTGTKFGCGIGQCGACSVHLNGRVIRSCSVPVQAASKQKVTTIEGVNAALNGALHPVQRAWIEEDVAQCGYCQTGQIMAAIDLLERHPAPSDDQIRSITNLCRCGTYPRIRKAIRRAASGESS